MRFGFVVLIALGLSGAADANWMARNQDPLGFWRVDGKAHVGATAQCVLAYLGAGYTDRGSGKENINAPVVRAAVKWLVSLQRPAGHIASDPCEHALATLALSELYWMTRNPRLKRPVERALACLVRQASPDDAWGDVVTNGFATAALRSGQFGGLSVPERGFRIARQWLERVTDAESGQVTAGDDRHLATAVGVFMRIMLREDPRTSVAIRKGADFLMTSPPKWEPEANQTYWYFGTLAMFQVSGSHWKAWNKHMKDAIVKHQHQRGSGWRTGSWDVLGPHVYGDVGATALMLMCIEVYYRYDRVFGLGGPVAETMKSSPSAPPWWRSTLPPHISRIEVGAGRVLPLESVSVRARVDGFRARVLLDCRFRNVTKSVREGRFKLRLPDGASPYYLAFGQTVDEAGTVPATLPLEPKALTAALQKGPSPPRVAVMAPREQARHAYVETVRQRVDPALLEWDGAGVFSARVFPLAPGKLHRVLLGYDVDLAEAEGGRIFDLALPDVPAVSVALDVSEGAAIWPEATPNRAAGRVKYNFPDTPHRRFAVRLPGVADVALLGDGCTAARLKLDMESDDTRLPSRAIFLVDMSQSSDPDQRAIRLELLRAILDSNRGPGEISAFRIYFFNVERFAIPDEFVPNTPENVTMALAYARALAAEGATDLGAALRGLPDEGADIFLLSDGVSTWGRARAEEMAAGLHGRLFAYDTGGATDREMLSGLAAATGGALIDAGSEARLRAASRAHRRAIWRVRSVAIDGCSDALANTQTIAAGDRVTVAARGIAGPDACARFVLERFGRVREIAVPLRTPMSSPLAARVYGEMAVGHLEPMGAAHHEQAIAYARHFRVVRETCSLLMLESERDYRRFGIRPGEAPVLKPLPRERSNDPRAAWKELITRLEEARQEIDPAVHRLLALLPDDEFVIRPKPLTCSKRTAAAARDLPGDLGMVVAQAEAIRTESGSGQALRFLSTTIDRDPKNPAPLWATILAAMRWGEPEHAYELLRREYRLENRLRPHPWMARALEDSGRLGLALLCSWLCESGRSSRDPLDPESGSPPPDVFHRLLLSRCARKAAQPEVRSLAAKQIKRQAIAAGGGLRIQLVWSDACDVDLHVTEPSGEICNYRRRATRADAEFSGDRRAFGPEVYVVGAPVAGTYVVRLHYYGRGDSLAPAVRAHVLVTHRGAVIREVETTMRLGEGMVEVARFTIEAR